jgi:hypothetical protein
MAEDAGLLRMLDVHRRGHREEEDEEDDGD